MSLQLSGNGVVTGLDSVGSSDLGTVLGSKLDLAGGKILQIVRATDATERTTTSTSVVDASISVTITPQKNNSAVIVMWSAFVAPGDNVRIRLSITDNSDNPLSGANAFDIGTSDASTQRGAAVIIGYSTPATINATTYKGRFATVGGTSRLLNNVVAGQLYAIEVSA